MIVTFSNTVACVFSIVAFTSMSLALQTQRPAHETSTVKLWPCQACFGSIVSACHTLGCLKKKQHYVPETMQLSFYPLSLAIYVVMNLPSRLSSSGQTQLLLFPPQPQQHTSEEPESFLFVTSETGVKIPHVLHTNTQQAASGLQLSNASQPC